ncbi:hypothetical protein [Amycolatopsis sp. NPDC004378]
MLVAADLVMTTAQAAAKQQLPAPSPIPTSECVKFYEVQCFSAQQIRRAYGIDRVAAEGITGKGVVIGVASSVASQALSADGAAFSAQFGLPAGDLRIVDVGAHYSFDRSDIDHYLLAHELAVQVQAIHAAAPAAGIVVATSGGVGDVDGFAETKGLDGVAEMMDAVAYLDRKAGADVVTLAWGVREDTLPGYDKGDYSALLNLRRPIVEAAKHGVAVLAASGNRGGSTTPGGFWPSSDPVVTAVGGTRLTLEDDGTRRGADAAWEFGGGYTSKIFARPDYQKQVRAGDPTRRLIPDVSITAADDAAMWYHGSTLPEFDSW